MNLTVDIMGPVFFALALASASRAVGQDHAEQRIHDLVNKMTPEEKVNLLSGTGFETKPIPRLGIPALKMTDGPVGVRWDQSTAFPVSIAMAATWDTALVRTVGWAIGREVKGHGRHMLLGPCININRVPQGGRDFESFGEDPYLVSRMATSYITGVQGEGVVACAKHYACNNQEWERTTIDAQVDERALREIYLPAFHAAVQEAGVWTVMSAYNKLNGDYCSENRYLLTDVLKREWEFKGFVVSDWGAVHSTVETVRAGLDLEMPDGKYLGDSLLAAVNRGNVLESSLDDKITRLLRVMSWAGLLDQQAQADPSLVNCKEHQVIALEVARAGVTLLKNEQSALPLDRMKITSLAVIGPNAAVARTGGGGSSQVSPVYAVSPLEGIRAKVGDDVQLRYAAGCRAEGDLTPVEASALQPPEGTQTKNGLRAEYFDNMNLNGKPVLVRIDSNVDFDWGSGSPAPEVPSDHFSARWTGKLVPPETGDYELSLQSDDGSRMFLDGKLVIDNWGDHAPVTRYHSVKLQAGTSYDVRLEFYENGGGAVARLGWNKVGGRLLADAVEAARVSDAAIVFVGLNNTMESEGFDRRDLALPAEQEQLIQAIAGANSRTIVVLNSGAPVTMSRWIQQVPALAEAWYPGSEGGNAVADILFGDVNPSGKLPVTFPKRWEDSPAFGFYPGRDGVVRYEEGILVGYRHFDAKNIEPLFPFGHGLSYTKFKYDNMQLLPAAIAHNDTIRVTLDVQNVGLLEGSEVVQLYIRDPVASVTRPEKELKGFRKIKLKPGEKRRVTFSVDSSALAFYDVKERRWTVEPGKFEVMIGSSSRDIRLNGSFEIR